MKQIKNSGNQLSKSNSQKWFDSLFKAIKPLLNNSKYLVIVDTFAEFTDPESGELMRIEIKEVKKRKSNNKL